VADRRLKTAQQEPGRSRSSPPLARSIDREERAIDPIRDNGAMRAGGPARLVPRTGGPVERGALLFEAEPPSRR